MEVDSKKLTTDINIANIAGAISLVGLILLFVGMIWSPAEYFGLVSKLLFTDLIVLIVSLTYYRIQVYETDRDKRGNLVVREEFKISDDE